MSWNEMSLFEQLSEVSGDVKRSIDSREKYLKKQTPSDFSYFYYNKAFELVLKLTLGDKEYRRREFIDEIFELREYINGDLDIDPQIIINYWSQYEKAVS